MKKECFEEYCTGCGLCKSIRYRQFIEKNDGFEYPLLLSEDLSFCSKMCPAGGRTPFKSNSMWGNISQVWLGWSTDNEIRNVASSGGVLTSLCCYLLDNGIVDGIIQTIVGDSSPYSTKTVISRNANDVKKCMGSRYSYSSPLSNIHKMIIDKEKYAFVGKPCDVQTFKLYLTEDQELSEKIVITLSFFCAGIPSTKAQKELLNHLGCNSEKECKRLDYRGNGWPGFATAYKIDGNEEKLSYDESWGKILGRKIRKSCRVCVDGIGESADIVCADAWYMTKYGKPNFSENSGRNIIFARYDYGNKVVINAQEKGYIYIEDGHEYFKSFSRIQKHQFERRATMRSMLFAMKLFGRQVPAYDKERLIELSKYISPKNKIRRFIGTCMRVIKGKI